ncbi:MAG: hypothetical protein AAFO61_00150 [Pseudomonadota bacterium]
MADQNYRLAAEPLAVFQNGFHRFIGGAVADDFCLDAPLFELGRHRIEPTGKDVETTSHQKHVPLVGAAFGQQWGGIFDRLGPDELRVWHGGYECRHYKNGQKPEKSG